MPRDGETDILGQIGVQVAGTVIGGLLLGAIYWYLATGQWIFDELLGYYVQYLEELD